MADVARVLLDQVDEQTAQAGDLTIGPARAQPVQIAVGQRLRGHSPRASYRVLPQRTKLLGRVLSGCVPDPVRVGVPVGGVPGSARTAAEELGGERQGLDERQVLQQPAQGERRRADRGAQARLIQAPGLPCQRGALALQGAEQRRGLVACQRGARLSLHVRVRHGGDSKRHGRQASPARRGSASWG